MMLKQIRSRYLAPLPQRSLPHEAWRIVVRLAIVGLGVGVIVALVAVVATRALPASGWTSWLYWLHDAVYLPVKGYTVTWMYPVSLAWWGVAALLLLLWLYYYLTGQSLIRQGRLWLTRATIQRPQFAAPLLTTAGRLRKVGLPPGYLHAVIAAERDVCLHQTAATGTHPAQLVHLTRLQLELEPPLPIEALALWHETFVAVRLSPDAGNALNRLLPLLDASPTGLDFENATPTFNPASLRFEILCLAALSEVKFAERVFKESWQPHQTRQHLIEAVSTRHHQLAQLRQQLERLVFDSRALSGAVAGWHIKRLLDDLTPLIPTTAHLPALGRLSLSIALDVAILTDQPVIAEAYLENLEALALVLAALDWDTTAFDPDPLAVLRGLGEGLPAEMHYHLTARLAAQHAARRETAWRHLSMLARADFDLLQARVSAWQQAAGPVERGR